MSDSMQLNFGTKLRAFLDNSKHILHISYKPSMQEFSKTARIIILGILVIGAIGYIISIVVGLLSGSTI